MFVLGVGLKTGGRQIDSVNDFDMLGYGGSCFSHNLTPNMEMRFSTL